MNRIVCANAYSTVAKRSTTRSDKNSRRSDRCTGIAASGWTLPGDVSDVASIQSDWHRKSGIRCGTTIAEDASRVQRLRTAVKRTGTCEHFCSRCQRCRFGQAERSEGREKLLRRSEIHQRAPTFRNRQRPYCSFRCFAIVAGLRDAKSNLV